MTEPVHADARLAARQRRLLPVRRMTARTRVGVLGVLLVAACRPGEAPRGAPASPPLPTGRSPVVRVGITVDTSAIDVSAATRFELSAGENTSATSAPAGETWRVTPAGDGGLVARSGDRTITSAGPITVKSTGGIIRIGNRDYRGESLIRAGRDGITAINIVDLEMYLMGVVPREIGKRPVAELEAVKAQAVAARTYAIGHRGARETLGFDYYAGVLDQVYGGIPDEDSIASRAVRETRGTIVTYGGLPILAYYSSTCGGRTAAIEESWPWRAPLPYLVSVSDRIPGGDEYYCSPSNRFRWTATWTRAQLLATLGTTLRAHTRTATVAVRSVDRADILRTNDSDRIDMRIDVDGTEYVLRADSVRWVLRVPAGGILNSSRIDRIESTRASDGALETLTVHGGGWGHGIGMCQVGALGRARAGQRYDEILRTYYRGTEIERLY